MGTSDRKDKEGEVEAGESRIQMDLSRERAFKGVKKAGL